MPADSVDRWGLIYDALDAASADLDRFLAGRRAPPEKRGQVGAFQDGIRDFGYELATLQDPVDWRTVAERLRRVIERCPPEVAHLRQPLDAVLAQLAEAHDDQGRGA